MLNPANLGVLVAIVAMLIPIVAILTAHQRKMAEIIHQNQARQGYGEIETLRQEMRELKQLIHQQAISLEDIRTRQALTQAAPAQGEIQTRLTGS